MGMYTELIFGCSLKPDTPELVIDSLMHMLGHKERPADFPLDKLSCRWMFDRASYSFGVCKPVHDMWFDSIGNNYVISVRCNIKNYDCEIETFLEWIKPHIEYGSGNRNMYAIVTYEEQNEPTIYYLE